VASLGRDEEYRRLRTEIESDNYHQLLRRLQWDHRFLRRFQSWQDVVAFMRAGSSEDPRKDDVLRPMFEAHQRDQDQRWRTLLLVIFWPGLGSILRRRRHWDANPEELWQTIVWVFLQVVCRIRVDQRPHRITQKLINETYRCVYRDYKRRWSLGDRETSTDEETLSAIPDSKQGVDLAGIERREIREMATRRLREWLAEGTLTQTDFLLLIGTRVYGAPLKRVARHLGLGYEAAKKRRQRSEAVLRKLASS
jgi:hypothetical protein